MCDSPLYNQFINSKKEDLLLFNLVCNALRDGVNVQTYKKRAIILESITDKENILKSSCIYHINSETTIELLIQKLFKDYPSRIITRNCENCPAKSFFSTFLISNIDKIQNVQSSIQSEEENCYMCGKIIENNLRYGYHIFVLTKKLIDYGKVSSSNYAQGISCKLDSIQKMLNIQGKSYKLRGAIELKRGISSEKTGHILFHSFREAQNQWQMFDDMQKTVVRNRPNKTVNCEMLLYTL